MAKIRDSGIGNIVYGNLKNEKSRYFLHNNLELPIIIEQIGITYPNKDYSIKRRNSDYYIMELITEGYGTLFYNGSKYELKPNTLYILKPDSHHEYYSNKKKPFKKVWINFFSDMFDDILKGLSISEEIVFYDVDLSNQFNKLIDISKISINSEDICYDILEILLDISLYLSRTKLLKTVHSDLAIKTKSILDSHVFRSINIDKVAKKLHRSKSQIIKEFRKNYNITPYKYLMDKRFEIAKNFLCHTDKTIYEIATSLSFVDTHYFSNAFKKETGKSPTQYRESCRNLSF